MTSILNKVMGIFDSDSKLVKFTDTFTDKIYSEFGKLNKIGSIYSAFSALVLLFEASAGSTRKELGKLLGFNPDNSYLNNYGSFNDMLTISGELQINNLIAVRDDMPIISQYFTNIKNIGIDSITFASPNELISACNQYANDKTNGLITELLTKEDVTPDTVSIICSTVYFLSKWKKPFDKSDTYERNFTRVNGSTIKLLHMCQYMTSFQYYKNDKLQYLEMSYQNEDYRIGVILPRTSIDLEYLNTIDMFRQCSKLCKETELNVIFPKFTHRSRVSLKNIVKKCGCNEIFENADLSNFTLKTDIRVSDIIHEAVVIIDEEKTEATGATVVIMEEESFMSKSYKIEKFIADHSFGYVIFHHPTGTILFNGCFDG
jgi:serpin B/serpin B11/12